MDQLKNNYLCSLVLNFTETHKLNQQNTKSNSVLILNKVKIYLYQKILLEKVIKLCHSQMMHYISICYRVACVCVCVCVIF